MGAQVTAVVCVGRSESASRLLTFDLQIDSEVTMSISREVHIPDFTPEKVAIMAEEYARAKHDCQFEDGLWTKLMKFIRASRIASSDLATQSPD
jgi:hypothetical protein